MKLGTEVRGKKKYWRVAWSVKGEERKRYFKTRKAAKAFARDTAEEMKHAGQAWSALSARDRAELIEWFSRSKEKGYTVPEACRFWEANGGLSENGVTVSDLFARFIEAKTAKGLRPESLRILKTTLKQFKAGREDKKASEVTREELAKFIANREGWGQWRKRGVVIDLHNAFSWAVRAGLLIRNPTSALERPTIELETPAVLTVEQCRKLLKLCRIRKHKALLPWLAVSLFAGLRAAEVARLKWWYIKPTHIELASSTTKGRARRLVTVQKALKAWLKLSGKRDGNVCPGNLKKRVAALRRDFGGMPKNVLRHSYISYELARCQNVDAVAIQAGNTPDIIFDHYREVVTPAAAKQFWALRP